MTDADLPLSGPDDTPDDTVEEPFSREHVTGEPRVDRALARLREVEQAPLAGHVAVYDEVHGLLHDALADLDGE